MSPDLTTSGSVNALSSHIQSCFPHTGARSDGGQGTIAEDNTLSHRIRYGGCMGEMATGIDRLDNISRLW